MSVLTITRDWGPNPSIVRIVTNDNLATITANGYLTAQAATINALNFGAFQWSPTDYVLMAYNGGEGFFLPDLVNMTFVQQGVQSAQVLVTSAQIKTMYDTPVVIIPAPSATSIIMLSRIVGVYLFGTAQYTAGGAIGLEAGAVAHGAGPARSTTLAAATFNGYAASNTFELTPDNTDTVANLIGLGVYLSNATADFATGDGTLYMDVNYWIAKAA
jgi:hypothetical protein